MNVPKRILPSLFAPQDEVAVLEIKHTTLGVFTKGILHLWLEKGALLTWELPGGMGSGR